MLLTLGPILVFFSPKEGTHKSHRQTTRKQANDEDKKKDFILNDSGDGRRGGGNPKRPTRGKKN